MSVRVLLGSGFRSHVSLWASSRARRIDGRGTNEVKFSRVAWLDIFMFRSPSTIPMFSYVILTVAQKRTLIVLSGNYEHNFS